MSTRIQMLENEINGHRHNIGVLSDAIDERDKILKEALDRLEPHDPDYVNSIRKPAGAESPDAGKRPPNRKQRRIQEATAKKEAADKAKAAAANVNKPAKAPAKAAGKPAVEPAKPVAAEAKSKPSKGTVQKTQAA